jgi:hypothetical protein
MNDSAFLTFATEASSFLDTVPLSEYYGPVSGTDDEISAICSTLMEASPDQRESFVSSMSAHQRHVLGRYSLRSTMLALRERSSQRLLTGLVAYALAAPTVRDPRDDMVALALHHSTATALGVYPATLFDQAAASAQPKLADLYRVFGRRIDVTPEAFGWRQVATQDGPTFEDVSFGDSPSGALVGERSFDEVQQARLEKLMRWVAQSRDEASEAPLD